MAVEKCPHESKVEEIEIDDKPPQYDAKKVIFIREEKTAVTQLEEDHLLNSNNTKCKKRRLDDEEGLKPPYIIDGVITHEAVLILYTAMLSMIFGLTPVSTLPKGDYAATYYAILLCFVNLFTFTGLVLRKHVMTAVGAVLIGAKLVWNSVFGIVLLTELFSPHFCRENGLSKGDPDAYRTCMENLPSLRWMAPILMLGQLALEIGVIKMLRSQTFYLQKLRERGGIDGQNKGKGDGKYAGLRDVDTSVGHVMV